MIPLIFNLSIKNILKQALKDKHQLGKINFINQRHQYFDYDIDYNYNDSYNKCDAGYLIHNYESSGAQINCNKLCNNESQYDLYEYKVIHQKDANFYGFGSGGGGGYCLPKYHNLCNPHINYINYIDNSLECISKFPELFQHINGIDYIVGCNGIIFNKKTQKTYNHTVPYNFQMDAENIQCYLTRDFMNNDLLVRLNQYDLISNYCGSLIEHFDMDMLEPNALKNGLCKIRTDYQKFDFNNLNDDPTLPITMCKHRWGGNVAVQGSRFSLNIAQQCINKNTPNSLLDKLVFPCPIANSHQSCLYAPLLASNIYSPMTLELLY